MDDRNNELRKRFSEAVVAVCGLGGLGSNIAIALARAGIGKLILIDYDRVDSTNLQRQQYKISQVGSYKTEALAENLQEIAPHLELEIYTEKITPENGLSRIREADVICEAFDDAGTKAMFVNLVLENLPEAYLVAASGMAGIGSANTIQTRRIMSHFYLCGDGISDIKEGMGLLSSRVMLCAAHQAHTTLRILAGLYEVL